MQSPPQQIKDNSKGKCEDRMTWTEYRGKKKEHSLDGKIVEVLPDGCYRVERVEFIKQVTEHIVHFEKVNQISR